ncbi:MAG: tyrosine--tRNA ligase [Peptococcaceae bacterium]|nr:tyrosine--tRNA ligase [Peptococcaceae bacterium]
MDVLQDLQYRGLVYQHTDLETLSARLRKSPLTLYCGFDPTADSLHIGHLLPVLVLRRFQLAGHRPIALVGGGTGLIGDPSGKTTERALNAQDLVANWGQNIRRQLEQFLDFDSQENPAIMADNYTWLSSLQVIDFLRDIGRHFSIGTMLAKDSVESRMNRGISYTEFSYMILQSYDYMKLHETYQCELQIGGQDQWGNITAGIDLIRRMSVNENKEAHALTLPLVTKSDGTKFGKTESGAIWLDATKTSPYQFYQFWLNTDDRDVVKFLKFFTFLPPADIDALAEEVALQPEKRAAHQALAREMTALVHGSEALQRARKISQALFSEDLKELSPEEIEEGFMDVPAATFQDDCLNFVDFLVRSGVVTSKRQAREAIAAGSIYVNNVRNTDADADISSFERIGGTYVVIRRGKKNYHLIRFV